MSGKLIDATEAKVGVSILIDGAPCIVKSQDISKTGKHGHAKARIEAVGVIDGKKRVIVVPGDTRFEVPLIDKRRAQILSIGDKISLMDTESFENFELETDKETREGLKEGGQVEYWIIEGKKIIKRGV